MEPSVTIISILPYEINDSKPNLYPGNFKIPKGSFVEPGMLAVTRSAFYVPMAFGAPSMQAFSSPSEVANSIINDYVGALLSVRENCKPGLFIEHRQFKNVDEFMTSPGSLEKLMEHREAQNNWFMSLVNLADVEYKQHSNANAISDLQKLAGKELNLKNKPWLQDITQLALVNCPACFNPVNNQAAICGSCRYVIDDEKYKAMRFASIPEINVLGK